MEENYPNNEKPKRTRVLFRKKLVSSKPIFTTNGKIRKHINTDTKIHELKKELGQYGDELKFAL